MAAVRLVLAAIVASASAPAAAEPAAEATCAWCQDGGAATVATGGLALPCEVRAALSTALAAPLFARPELPPPPTVAIAELLPLAAAAPSPAPVLPDAPKTSPPG